MKKLMAGAVIVSCIAFYSCGGSNSSGDMAKDSTEKDAKEVAENKNENKFDSTDLKDDAAFAVKIADASMLEIELGKLALTNASSPKVKEYAKMMIDDHTKASAELKDAANKKNISLPAGMSDKCQKKYNDLSTKKGKEFDNEYMAAMVDGHQDVLNEMKTESEKGKDADLRLWAMNKIDVINHHLVSAKTTKETLN